MNMKWSLFKIGLLFLCLNLIQDLSGSNSGRFVFPSDSLSGYDRKLQKYESQWYRLIPRYQKIQYAGSMGLISLGVGWEYGRDHWETDVMLGFLPRFEDQEAKVTFTLKQNYIPWEFNLGKSNWAIEPLTCGLYMNSILDNRFWKKEPRRYPDNYYKFSTRIRFHVFAGQRMIYHIPNPKRLHKSITAFYELSSCDLYIISAVTNSRIRARDYLSLSFGIKLQIF
ncbi:MAG: hypothetical protein RR346_01960 [Bacteroidales bacterium]